MIWNNSRYRYEDEKNEAMNYISLSGPTKRIPQSPAGWLDEQNKMNHSQQKQQLLNKP